MKRAGEHTTQVNLNSILADYRTNSPKAHKKLQRGDDRSPGVVEKRSIC